MKRAEVIARDFAGIARVCGPGVAARWLLCVVAKLPQCLRERNLQPADRLMGSGPFIATRGSTHAKLAGPQVISGIREIWVRDVYLKDRFLDIPRGALVVDLGANMGNFTLLALAMSEVGRTIAVEPHHGLSKSLQSTIELNGWATRAQVVRAFIGVETQSQASLAVDAEYRDVPYVQERDFLRAHAIRRIDFLKCDIEGSEFFLLDPGSSMLSITDRIAIEIHSWGGSVEHFLRELAQRGFEVGPVHYDGTGSCIALARRAAHDSATASVPLRHGALTSAH